MAEKTNAEIEKKKEIPSGKIVQVPTEYGIAFQLEDESVVNTNELLICIYNDVQKLKKSLL